MLATVTKTNVFVKMISFVRSVNLERLKSNKSDKLWFVTKLLVTVRYLCRQGISVVSFRLAL